MKTFKIAHLYYDLMNLYGENGNIKCLKKHLEAQNIPVEITYLSLEDEIDFTKYDFFYIGSGNDESLKLCLNDIKNYQKQIIKAIDDNKFFLVTGNALTLFGKNLQTQSETIEALNILKYNSKQILFRIVGEQTYEYNDLKIIGFDNRDWVLEMVKEKHLFDVIKGSGYVPKSSSEGISKNNFMGSFLLGPILIRNPFFTEIIVQKIMKQLNHPYQPYHHEWEEQAYKEYLKNFSI